MKLANDFHRDFANERDSRFSTFFAALEGLYTFARELANSFANICQAT
jgi:hypothetical protein